MPTFAAKWLTSLKLAAVVSLVAGLLAACQTAEPRSAISVTATDFHSVQPNVSLPSKPRLQVYSYDLPRQTNVQQLVKNTSACKAVSKAAQDVAFWRRCGEFPVDPNSNLFIGFDQANWHKFQSNQREVETYVQALEERIAQVNAQRGRERALAKNTLGKPPAS